MNDKLYYARQVEPEFQIADIWDDDYYKDIICIGNRNFRGMGDTSIIETVTDAAEDALDEYNMFVDDIDWDVETTDNYKEEAYSAVAEYLTKNYTTEKHREWTAEQAQRLIENYNIYAGNEKGTVGETDEYCIAEMLSVYTGEEYDTRLIRGCCQGDCQRIYYSTEQYSDNAIKTFEIGYFNLGTEWEIHEEKNVPQSPDDICGCCYYCYSDNPRKELAEAIGCKPEQLVMYEYDGTVPKTVYKENEDNPQHSVPSKNEIGRG